MAILRALSLILLLLLLPGTHLLAQQSDGQCHVHQGWVDSDGDRIPDIIEGDGDADEDGLENYLDEDADGDGIPDASEAYNSPSLSGLDIDFDGIDDAYDADKVFEGVDLNEDGVDDALLPVDTDLDGIPDFLDTDSDNDGLDDAVEINSSSYYTDEDTDDDGLNDLEEKQLGTAPNKYDSDGGGVSDWWESYLGTDPLDSLDDHIHPDNLDVDNDGIPNELEGYRDSDNDQIPDYMDLDSDNDGWFDIIEAGLPDFNGDGRFDDQSDENSDGLADAAEGLLVTLPDQDNDGLPNSQDLDADNDGLGDAFEMGDSLLLQHAGLAPLDIDSDGIPNNLDLDSDGDLVPDSLEAGFPDEDADGVTDLVNDSDADGLPDSIDIDFTLAPDNVDTDNDGIADRFDTDHSVETLVTTNWSTLEEQTIVLPNTDVDEDGIVDRHDPDHNGDGEVDEYRELQYEPAELTTDADGDGLIAMRDNDDQTAFENADAFIAPEPDTDNEGPSVTEPYVPLFDPCPVAGTEELPVESDETGETDAHGESDTDTNAESDENANPDSEEDPELELGAALSAGDSASDGGGAGNSDSGGNSGGGAAWSVLLILCVNLLSGIRPARRITRATKSDAT